jgi:hypothetical protein
MKKEKLRKAQAELNQWLEAYAKDLLRLLRDWNKSSKERIYASSTDSTTKE